MTALHHIANRTKTLPPLRVGIGGPVGSGKTTLLEMLCKAMRERYDLQAGTAYVVRPDQHVAARMRQWSVDTVRAAVQRACGLSPTVR